MTTLSFDDIARFKAIVAACIYIYIYIYIYICSIIRDNVTFESILYYIYTHTHIYVCVCVYI